MPDAGILATVMLLAGLFLLGLEFFIPSFGMILVMASISLIVSFWSACKAWWGIHPYFFWTYVVLLLGGIPGSLIAAISLIQKTSLGNRMILNPVPVPEVPPESPLMSLRGKQGVAQTLMTPGGIVVVESVRYHAESVGMLIEPSTPVIVVGARSNRLVVRPRTEQDAESAANSDPDSTDSSPSSPIRGDVTDAANTVDPLDFSIPEDYTDKN